MLSTTAVGILGMMLTGDPLSDLYRENGLLTQGRNLGFTVAQAGLNNGAITPGGGGAQLQHLTGLIADATVRMPLQLMNFGEPIDNIGGCGQAYTAAMLTPHDPGDLAGPARHDPLRSTQALSFANTSTAPTWPWACSTACSAPSSPCSSATSPTATSWPAARPAQRAALRRRGGRHDPRRTPPPRRRRLTLFFKHAALLFAYTLYISVTALIVLKMAARGGYADQVGMTHRWPAHHDRPVLRRRHRRLPLAQTPTRRPQPPRTHPRRDRTGPPWPRRLPTRRDTYDRGATWVPAHPGTPVPPPTATPANPSPSTAGGRPPAGGPTPGAPQTPPPRHPAVHHHRRLADHHIRGPSAAAAARTASAGSTTARAAQPRPPRRSAAAVAAPKSSPARRRRPRRTQTAPLHNKPDHGQPRPRHHALRRLNPHSSHHRPATDATPGPSHRLRRHRHRHTGRPRSRRNPVKAADREAHRSDETSWHNRSDSQSSCVRTDCSPAFRGHPTEKVRARGSASLRSRARGALRCRAHDRAARHRTLAPQRPGASRAWARSIRRWST
ncbi:putative transcriptional regulator domain protein [Mycobacterium intracellulare MIN_052511_1280]|nr:putative transcriptional regulator domain protein [Mycobacterium intracellulare MIN_052511_1280]